jgi:hypothetical protein
MPTTYQITADQDTIIIRLPREMADVEELAALLDYLELEAIRRRSQLTPKEARYLAQDVKKGAWQQVKHLFVGP